ncbi:MAG: hypothetical protein KKF30_03660 [Proteobacteria bacterium]|nr:hypothetical protein [Pseudomonadota bacterium]MBU4470153.1 hypothetical protein [Pseudomonadota bacterium]MCG2753136.1 hypothetical protein [Desulfobacteraceae bacterium]
MVSPPGEPVNSLEVVYFADPLTTGPAVDRVCFVVHARITFLHQGEVLYRDILRIDPRLFSDNIQPPDWTRSPERILTSADEAHPENDPDPSSRIALKDSSQPHSGPLRDPFTIPHSLPLFFFLTRAY